MLPTLVMTALLSIASPSAPAVRLQTTSQTAHLEVAALESAEALEDDGFESDRSGFAPRKATTTASTPSPVTQALWLARTFLGVWLVASALFGIVWGLLGWAISARRIAARA